MRSAILTLCLVAVTVTQALAQTGSAPSPSMTVTPVYAAGDVARAIDAQNLPPNSALQVLVIDPGNGQTVSAQQTDAGGNVHFVLTPPPNGLPQGPYRIVLALPGGRSISRVFVVGDPTPMLYELTSLPSPTSALNILGTGFPPGQEQTIDLTLANGRGDRPYPVTANADGIVTLYLWPQQLDEPFFEAGAYQIHVQSLKIEAQFDVREHPVGPSIIIDQPVRPELAMHLQLNGYRPNRIVWAVYADTSGNVLGEFVAGITDSLGHLDTQRSAPDLPSGQYLLASPYDWGETAFEEVSPTATPTLTPSPTATSSPTPSPTVTSTPTPTPTSTPKPKPTRRPTARPSPTHRKAAHHRHVKCNKAHRYWRVCRHKYKHH
ncbi:MAG: hypothetical protein ACRDFX_08965 [Chloroflexota bacterium]